jgi:hypothetical protein
VGDFNGDGIADLAVANLLGSNISILPGKPNGRFGKNVEFTAGDEPIAVAAGQFHGNGPTWQDIVVTNDESAAVTFFLNKLPKRCE